MSPIKSFDLLLDEVIETNINCWIEARHKDEEAEQEEFTGWDA